MWKIVLPVVVAALMILAAVFAFRAPSAPAPTASTPAGESAKSPDAIPDDAAIGVGIPPEVAGDNWAARLTEAQNSLLQAIDLMKRASTGNKGGYVEKSRADLAQAQTHLSQVAGALQNSTVKPSAATDSIPALLDKITKAQPRKAGGPAPNLRQALVALANVLRQLQGMPDAGGLRDQTITDISLAVSDIISGIEAVPTRGNGRGTGLPGGVGGAAAAPVTPGI